MTFHEDAMKQIEDTLAAIPQGPLAVRGFETSKGLADAILDFAHGVTAESFEDDRQRLIEGVALLGATFIMTSTVLGYERDEHLANHTEKGSDND